MDIETFQVIGKNIIDEICEYAETVNSMHVFPDVMPGYLKSALADYPPEKPDEWEEIVKDFNKHILRGVTHWRHNQFFAYLPSGSGFSSLLGNLISNAIGVVPLSWMASPAANELEIVVMDWLCKSLDLPEEFLSTSTGGGVMQSTATECLSNCILSARSYAINKLKDSNSDAQDTDFLPKLVAYCSEEADASLEKISKLSFVKLKILETDEEFTLRGETLKKTIKKDISNGYIPIFLCAGFGTNGSGAVDHFAELGDICKQYDMWFHVDGSYGGCSLFCEEMRGLSGIREYQRNHIRLAKLFEEMLINDGRFEVVNKVVFGLVCFRLKDVPDEINQEFLSVLNESKLIHMTPVQLKGRYTIRFCISAAEAKDADITTAFEQIQIYATKLLEETENGKCTCNLPRQFAFIKKVPKEVYDRLEQPMLYNMASPILVPADKNDDNVDNEDYEEFYQI
ncbi:tyrosine decarboxylase-like [Arctopsyche grandis]|uniref:tyrosine decarboxylase-like n=1 Tax=Arctopsyche grandis TaxID=121162 RepID=UPI00406D75CB